MIISARILKIYYDIMCANPHPNKRKPKCELTEKRYLGKAGLWLIYAVWLLWNIKLII